VGRVVLLHLARWTEFTTLGYLGIVHNCTQFEINFPDLRMNLGMARLSGRRNLGGPTANWVLCHEKARAHSE
jgi:hypothetical protein